MSSEMRIRTAIFAALAATTLGSLGVGCSYDEQLPNADLYGVVRIPKELATIELINIDGERWEVNDPRAIGPIYIGTYAGIDETLYEYPHPEWGPVLNEEDGDAFPYGGTTVGRFTWGCYQATVCQTVTGRYESYEDVLEYFRDVVRSPITDDSGREITSAEEFQEKCFQAEYVTSDDELDLIGPTDFEDMGEYYEAPVEILHSAWVPGLSVWGFADMPAVDYTFDTCDPTQGDYQYYYDEQYYKGTNQTEILNYPGYFIKSGDLVSWEAAVVTDSDQDFVLELGYKYE